VGLLNMARKYAHLDADRIVVGFYNDDFHGDAIPSDAVPISDAHHAALLEGQSAGKRMALCKKGKPLLLDPPEPSVDDLAASLRARRDAALAATDWLVLRHQDERVLGGSTTLTDAQATKLAKYRQALRALPQASGFPRVELPTAPSFIGV
jgi:hypothetical protein